jgi:hypothetical protein
MLLLYCGKSSLNSEPYTQGAAVPRLKRVVLLLHKIGEGLHTAKSSDHPNNLAGAKHIASFTSKLSASLQSMGTGLEIRPAEAGAGVARQGPPSPAPEQDAEMAGSEDEGMGLDAGARGIGEDEEEVSHVYLPFFYFCKHGDEL